jgi:hypothetical protein
MDYSLAAIDLARECHPGLSVNWCQCDFLSPGESFLAEYAHSFDLLIDKGTLDAICLSGVPLDELIPKYRASLVSLLRKSLVSRFMITSCNSTFEELEQMFTVSDAVSNFVVEDTIKHAPAFVFQGSTGQSVSSVVFRL